jgi:hypothetical protein
LEEESVFVVEHVEAHWEKEVENSAITINEVKYGREAVGVARPGN